MSMYVFLTSYLYFSQVIKWKKLYINKNKLKFIISCSLTATRLKIQKFTVNSRNKPNATTLFKARTVIIRLISTKNVDKNT